MFELNHWLFFVTFWKINDRFFFLFNRSFFYFFFTKWRFFNLDLCLWCNWRWLTVRIFAKTKKPLHLFFHRILILNFLLFFANGLHTRETKIIIHTFIKHIIFFFHMKSVSFWHWALKNKLVPSKFTFSHYLVLIIPLWIAIRVFYNIHICFIKRNLARNNQRICPLVVCWRRYWWKWQFRKFLEKCFVFNYQIISYSFKLRLIFLLWSFFFFLFQLVKSILFLVVHQLIISFNMLWRLTVSNHILIDFWFCFFHSFDS